MKTSSASKLLPMLALLSVLMIQGCSTTRTTSTDDACLIWSAIDYHSKTDAPDTILRIRQNNAKHDSYCGAKP